MKSLQFFPTHRSILKPASLFELSDHERSIWVADTAVADKLLGAFGSNSGLTTTFVPPFAELESSSVAIMTTLKFPALVYWWLALKTDTPVARVSIVFGEPSPQLIWTV